MMMAMEILLMAVMHSVKLLPMGCVVHSVAPRYMMLTTMEISSAEVLPDYVMTVLLPDLSTTQEHTLGLGVVSE